MVTTRLVSWEFWQLETEMGKEDLLLVEDGRKSFGTMLTNNFIEIQNLFKMVLIGNSDAIYFLFSFRFESFYCRHCDKAYPRRTSREVVLPRFGCFLCECKCTSTRPVGRMRRTETDTCERHVGLNRKKMPSRYYSVSPFYTFYTVLQYTWKENFCPVDLVIFLRRELVRDWKQNTCSVTVLSNIRWRVYYCGGGDGAIVTFFN